METTKKDKWNVEKYGLGIGIIIPALSILGIYFYQQPEGFGLFLRQVFFAGVYNKFIGLSIIPNFLVYFYSRWKSRYRFAEGISIATLIYLIIIVIIKYAT